MSFCEVSNHLTGGRSFYETSAKYRDKPTEKTERWNARESRTSLTMAAGVQRKNTTTGQQGIEPKYIYLYRGVWDTAVGHAEAIGTNDTTFSQAFRYGIKVAGFHVDDRKLIGSKP